MQFPEKKYDFVIIGSGIGGLVTALILAKQGKSVCILEKNQQIGGALQVFSRDKRIFDTGVHYIGGLEPGGNLNKIFNYLGILDDLKLVKLNPVFDIIRMPNGKNIQIGQGYDHYRTILIKQFPEEEHAIDQFITKIQDLCTYFPLYNLRLEGDQTYYSNGEILTESAWEFVQSLTKNEDLIAAFLGNAYLYAGDYKRTPLYVVALVLNSYINGSYRIEDGGAKLIKAFVKQLRKYDVAIFKRKEVVAGHLSSDKMLESVSCEDGSTYFADFFISNLHPTKTLEVIGNEKFLPATVKRYKSLKNTVGAFVVNIALKENSFPYINHNNYDFFTENVFDTTDYSLDNWPEVIFSCTSATSNRSEFASTFSAMAYLSIAEFEEFKTTFNTVVKAENRGESYENRKKYFEQKLMLRLLERYPDLEKSILSIHSSTPLTFRDYLGTPEGELYGIEKNFNDPIRIIINPKTKLSNVFMTGQSIVFQGILGSTIGALVTSFNFVNGDAILSEINRC